ncbi:flagellar basal-body MS-ring/collar protein FliF [Radiobacillus deserti]|uniref:Flagellar M-ring protein n=1 Tax=Radiobacillus deserti TaxID=2594883 RepID=A0A516KFK5_9BACI|nr:flagellar basal-body MS-ring/collar protein FliF [Radiobacillus deserti]QDP40173.1 flagellar basal body M-ring protein FliF [Radiobacillus deserti]
MKQNLNAIKDKLLSFWSSKSGKQKRFIIGAIIAIILVIGISGFFMNRTNMVPLYNNLSLQEVGQIKAELDARSVPYELDGGGTTILVPDDQVESLLVDLASQGLPDSGNIDYSFFSKNASWGMTDNEFNLIKLDAMQTELANLIKSVEGIEDAKVMINKPQDPVFVSDQAEAASASIVVSTKPGYQFEQSQVETLYRLVSKTVPNLPTENIVIMDQNFQYFDLENPTTTAGSSDVYTYQQNVKNDIERDIQRRVQQMIGMMVGQDKVIASVTADIDFTQENRTEELVEPVNEEDMEGLPVSIETIKETYTGTPPADGVVGAGEEDVANYPAGEDGTTGDYEMVKESINNEFNRIKKDIVESPYKIRDLGIQVAVDKTKYPAENGGEVELLSEEEQLAVEEGISSILNSIITTSVDEGYGEVVPEDKVSIVFQEFQGQATPDVPATGIPTWVYIAGGAALLVIAGLVIWLMRRRRDNTAEEEVAVTDVPLTEEFSVPEMEKGQDSESTVRRKQLEKMAKEKPEDFAKLLRSWIAED